MFDPQNDSTNSASFPQWKSDAPLGTAPAPFGTPLGTTVTAEGTYFVVSSANASAIDLCLWQDGTEKRIQLFGPDNGLWSVFVPGVGVGTQYNYRAYGPWDPTAGHLFNPAKLLIDPYAMGLTGTVEAHADLYPHLVDDELHPTAFPPVISPVDSSARVPRCVITEARFPLAPGPKYAWEETVVYEAHVKGFTLNLPGVRDDLRGTYAGLASEAAISYLKDLGITTLELLPIHAKSSEPFLAQRGLSNYWGYSTLSYFYPEPSYATAASQAAGPQAVIDEFRGMVSLLHEAGIEVVLDVVYNHTCEGGEFGPSLSWRGLDNLTYYLQDFSNPGRLWDVTGTGNSLDFGASPVVAMTLDSLRFWANEMGVDGFRFDLGVTLARNRGNFLREHPFLVAASSDPILRTKKLIMEPWDVGYDGWHTGDFPVPFGSWNDRFRSDVRNFWVATVGAVNAGEAATGQSALATRLAGSADTYYRDPQGVVRSPLASVNYVTAHDGFTMADLVSFNHKHNEANKEQNRDGSDDNRSWNHGFEGTFEALRQAEELSPSEKQEISDFRTKSIKNLFATLMISAGIPMICAGDEFGRTQQGNNNAYCQDSAISWVDWDWDTWQEELHSMTRQLIHLRRQHPVLRPTRFATGKPTVPGHTHRDLAWFNAKAMGMDSNEWSQPTGRILQMHRCSGSTETSDALVVINGTAEPQIYKPAVPTHATAEANLVINAQGPNSSGDLEYQKLWDSAWSTYPDQLPDTITASSECKIEPFSMQIFLSKVD
ncbi:glycogen debranching enzyme GlgX [Boudabousia liubingyangii]|uniref:Glycogen debranching enzyme GlgX n=1 Tax=Boudabousia liubingyangii TaxID=1921764 RepID=A0A1Q5PKR9_9ACTO|nr:glycogen debranching protein GlgX [Boudabousia liubingyangii]OKL46450.1 glycogen debranching enzyme GlgX [Boudabousia liubingyangii]OKL47227.1 glycogen debranching enzyme GlgX [Boudabousia liubingyangii]